MSTFIHFVGYSILLLSVFAVILVFARVLYKSLVNMNDD